MYFARQLTGKTFRAIARFFGDRDHTMVVRACRRIERLRLANAELDGELQALASQMGVSAAPKSPDNSTDVAKGGTAQSGASHAQQASHD
jgi:hypothetical protein